MPVMPVSQISENWGFSGVRVRDPSLSFSVENFLCIFYLLTLMAV